MKTQLYMVFDVESIGLHGEGFAVGYVVVREDGTEEASALFACPSSEAKGDDEGRKWIDANCPPLPVTHLYPNNLRNAFWEEWRKWAAKGALLVADCCWPVEARFLIDCVDGDFPHRNWEGPYPLHDLATLLLAQQKDPTARTARLPDELPEHNPLCDARQSARAFLRALAAQKTLLSPNPEPKRNLAEKKEHRL